MKLQLTTSQLYSLTNSSFTICATTDPTDEFRSPYTYCANNPVMLVDPDGKRAIKKAIYELNNFHVVRYGDIHNKLNNVKLARCNQIEYFGFKGGYGRDFGLNESMYPRRLDYEKKEI